MASLVVLSALHFCCHSWFSVEPEAKVLSKPLRQIVLQKIQVWLLVHLLLLKVHRATIVFRRKLPMRLTLLI